MEKELKMQLAIIRMQYGDDLPDETQEIVNQIEDELKKIKHGKVKSKFRISPARTHSND